MVPRPLGVAVNFPWSIMTSGLIHATDRSQSLAGIVDSCGTSKHFGLVESRLHGPFIPKLTGSGAFVLPIRGGVYA